ncbi:MAG: glucokinase [Desulfovibrionaceae bacterium]|nr:glucokinase [Desulfovibrionaceae bacterium]MBF0514895.1 glucokinase [Desulfovibrionaceae bacterium]
MTRILAADVGGTNSRFAVFEVLGGELALSRAQVDAPTAGASCFEELLERALTLGLAWSPQEIDVAVLAVAGPVEAGRYAKLANAALTVDARSVGERFGLTRVVLINDFLAQAYACLSPAAATARVVQAGKGLAQAALAVIGAGTGLGHCALIPDRSGGYLAAPSEAGHAAFPFTVEETDVSRFIRGETGQDAPYVEAVVSGPGLALIHKFCTGRDLSPTEAAAELTPGSQTAGLFARFYGRACRNYVLACLGRGGLFVSGGVAAKNPFLVDHDAFRTEFSACPAFADWLAKLPVKLVGREDFGLWGAAVYGLKTM